MGIVLDLVLSAAKKYWIYILIAGLIMGYTVMVYRAGIKSQQAQYNKAVIEEIQKRDKIIADQEERYESLKRKIETRGTLTDKEYSCIFSKDPFKGNCVQ